MTKRGHMNESRLSDIPSEFLTMLPDKGQVLRTSYGNAIVTRNSRNGSAKCRVIATGEAVEVRGMACFPGREGERIFVLAEHGPELPKGFKRKSKPASSSAPPTPPRKERPLLTAIPAPARPKVSLDGKPVLDEEIAFDNPFGRMAEALAPYTEGATVGVMVTLISAMSGYVGPTTRVGEDLELSSPLSAWFVLVGVSGRGRKGRTARISVPVVKKGLSGWADKHFVTGVPNTGLGLMETLVEHNAPLWVLEEEMDQFLEATKDRKIGVYFRKAWDGAPIAHKTSKSDLKVSNPHLAFLGHVQPKNWRKVSGTSDASGGTYNRFLPIHVEKSKTVPRFGGPRPGPAIEEQAKIFRKIGVFAREVDLVKITPELAVRFEEHHRPIVERMTEDSEEMAEMAERSMDYLVRIAALYALGDQRDEINERDLDSALELIRYSNETLRYVLKIGDESITNKIKKALAEHGELSMSELWDHVGRNKTRRDILDAIKTMPNVEIYKGKSTGGRPPIMIRAILADDELEEIADEDAAVEAELEELVA
ncbi:DUF3987 domain-containing protein [Spirillospora sp. NPDC127200]